MQIGLTWPLQRLLKVSVSYAILCMNCCVVLLDRIGRPVKFGAPKKEAAK